MSRRPILIVLTVALTLRLVSVGVNGKNRGTFFGHSINAAAVAATFVRTGQFGFEDDDWTSQFSQRIQTARALIDPEDAGVRQASFRTLKPNFEDELGLPAIMGALWTVFPMRFVYVEVLQAFLDTLCVWLLFHAALRLFEREDVAQAAAWLYALFPLQVAFIAYPVPYVWPMFLAAALLYLLARFFVASTSRGAQFIGAVLIGGAIGVAALVRSTTVWMPVFIFGSFTILLGFRRAVVLTLVVIATEVTLLSPVLVRNHGLFGQYRASRGVFWHNFWVGFGAHDNPFGLAFDDHVAARVALEGHPGVKDFGPEYEQIVKGKVISAIRRHPGWFVRVQATRVAWIVVPPGWKRRAVALPLYAAALIGLLGSLRRHPSKRRAFAALAMPTLYFFLSIAVVYPPTTKFVLPGYVYLLMLAAAVIPVVRTACATVSRRDESDGSVQRAAGVCAT